MLGFLLIAVDQDKKRIVGDRLLKLDQVKNIHMIKGEFDLIVKVEADDLLGLQNFIMDHIRPIIEIQRTDTLIVAQ